MADESLSYESEDARRAAINELPNDTTGLEQLEKILSAPLTEALESEKTTDEEVVAEVPAETPTEPEIIPPVESSTEPVIFNIKKEDLPLNYDTPEKLIKGTLEKQALIDRQAEYIKSLDEKHAADIQALKDSLGKAGVATQNLQVAQKDAGVKPDVKPIGASKVNRITELQAQMSSFDNPFDEELPSLRKEFDDLITEEMTRVSQIALNAQQKTAELEAQSKTFFQSKEEDVRLQKQTEYVSSIRTEIDTLGTNKDYAEYKLTEPVEKVDARYLNWINDVGKAYYGKVPTLSEARHAIDALLNRSPDLMKKCELAQIPTTPDKDIETYMELCEVLDYKEGFRTAPDGTRTQAMKWDPVLQCEVPDTFSTIADAIANKRVHEGYYKKKELDAYGKGGADVLTAAQRRDDKYLDSSNASSEGLTADVLAQQLDSFDEYEALQKYRSGDTMMLDEYNKLRKMAGWEPMTLDQF